MEHILHTHKIHVWYIYLHFYIPYMDPMGYVTGMIYRVCVLSMGFYDWRWCGFFV